MNGAEESRKVIGGRIRKARERAGITPSELATRLGLTRFSVYKYENGTVDISVSRAGEIAAILDCAPEYLMGRQSDMGAYAYIDQQETAEGELTDYEQAVIDDLKRADPAERRLLFQMLRGALSKGE